MIVEQIIVNKTLSKFSLRIHSYGRFAIIKPNMDQKWALAFAFISVIFLKQDFIIMLNALFPIPRCISMVCALGELFLFDSKSVGIEYQTDIIESFVNCVKDQTVLLKSATTKYTCAMNPL